MVCPVIANVLGVQVLL